MPSLLFGFGRRETPDGRKYLSPSSFNSIVFLSVELKAMQMNAHFPGVRGSLEILAEIQKTW